jgi:anti-sigma B factor antagonist
MSRIKRVRIGDVWVLVVDQERLVDDLTLQDVHRELVDALSDGEDTRFVLDLNRVAFVASAALGMLVRIRKRCGESGKTLKLCNVGPAVDETFRITGLNTLFEIHPDTAEAIASFNAQSA